MLNKIYLAISSAIPVIFRILVLFISSKIIIGDSVSSFVNDYNVVLAVSLLSSMGVASHCLVYTSKDNSKNYLFTSLVFVSITSLMAALAIYFLWQYQYVYYFKSLVAYSCSYSFYMVLRHFFLGKQRYLTIVIYELFICGIFLLSLCFYNVTTSNDLFEVLSFSYAFVTIILISRNIKLSFFFEELNKENSLKYIAHSSLSNFISSGIGFLIPSYINHFISKDIVLNISLIQQMSSLVTFVTRNVSLFYIAIFSATQDLYRNYCNFTKINNIVLSLSILVFVISLSIYSILFKLDVYFSLTSLFVILFVVFSQVSLPASNILMVRNKVEKITFSNGVFCLLCIVVFLLFILVYGMLELQPWKAATLLYILLCLNQIVKSYMILNFAKMELSIK